MTNTIKRASAAAGLLIMASLSPLVMWPQSPPPEPGKAAPPTTKLAPKKLASKTKKPKAKPTALSVEGVKQDAPRLKKKVVYDGGTVTSVGEVYPGVSHGGDLAEQTAAADWMNGAETNLQRLEDLQRAGKLNTSQTATKAQAQLFLHQSREAAHDGDLPRARTLAQKAKLLSDSLLPH